LSIVVRNDRFQDPAELAVLAPDAVFNGRRLLTCKNLGRLPLDDGTVILRNDFKPQQGIGGILFRLVSGDDLAVRFVDLFHDPPILDPDVVVVIGDGGPQAAVAALRFFKFLFRLLFRHFVVMSKAGARSGKRL
jgi:hypothetical protein